MNEPAAATARIPIGGMRITPQSTPLELALRACPPRSFAGQRQGRRLGSGLTLEVGPGLTLGGVDKKRKRRATMNLKRP